jgi:hypothetical protein
VAINEFGLATSDHCHAIHVRIDLHILGDWSRGCLNRDASAWGKSSTGGRAVDVVFWSSAFRQSMAGCRSGDDRYRRDPVDRKKSAQTRGDDNCIRVGCRLFVRHL